MLSEDNHALGPRNSPDLGFRCGPYRARTDDIHGVNVALYQLS